LVIENYLPENFLNDERPPPRRAPRGGSIAGKIRMPEICPARRPSDLEEF